MVHVCTTRKENMGPETLHVPFLYKGIRKKREPVSRFLLEKCLIIRFGSAEVALQQALESLAVAGKTHGTCPMGAPVIPSARAE